jgi:hypothetical protein
MKDGVVIGASVVMILAGVGLTIMLEPFANKPATEAGAVMQGDAPLAPTAASNAVLPPPPVLDTADDTQPGEADIEEEIGASAASANGQTSATDIPADESTDPDQPVLSETATVARAAQQGQPGQQNVPMPPAPVMN